MGAAFVPATVQAQDIRPGSTEAPSIAGELVLPRSDTAAHATLDMISIRGSGFEAIRDSNGAQVGYIAQRLRSATKTDTPFIDTPQAISVVTQQQLRDQNVQSVSEALRFVPGVSVAQGEGHRDELLIRGQRSSADFFVNGIRDDSRYIRDVYNAQRIEVLKGPNALIFGRGGGGGIVNRVLKEADGVPIREVLVQGGQFFNKRVAVDVGDRVSDTVFFRLNGVFEDTDTYRDFIDIRRYGVNPTMTFLLGPQTTLRLSYEYFDDDRIADRGIPSKDGRPWRYRENRRTLFGAPFISSGFGDAHIGNAQLDHVFENGVVMRSQTRIADYGKFHQNAYPNSPVNAAETSFVMRGYASQTDRTNYFNQTDFTYKFETGPIAHTLVTGLDLGYQEGIDFRRDFIWDSTGTRNLPVNPFAPVTRESATLRNLATGRNNTYALGIVSAFAQDQIEIDEHLQFIVGGRYDRFDFESRDRRQQAPNGVNARVDDLFSPRLGVVVKPLPNLAFYGSYSVSFLPSSGDQFRVLSPQTAQSAPERFENVEVGFKYDITPVLQFTGALFNLDRDNQPFPSNVESGLIVGSGQTRTQGLEIGLAGYLTDWWQVFGGYAYTEPRVLSALEDDGDVIEVGNLVGGVPLHTFSLFNKVDINEQFSVGLGYYYQDTSFASSDNTVRLPSYSRFDAGLFYRLNELTRVQLNVENIFDRNYIVNANNNNNLTPGAPRTVRVQLIARF